MTRDEIIRMAREAGFRAGHIELYSSDPMPFVAPCSATDCMPELVRFAAIVAAAERDACAQVCEDRQQQYNTSHYPQELAVIRACAAAIRARGNA